MNNYLIVTDSASAMDPQVAKENGIELVSLSVIFGGKEYKDHIDIDKDTLYNVLREGEVPSTTQPNLGYAQELMKEWKLKNYDRIIVIAVSGGLSGAVQAFHLAAEQEGLDNVSVIDSRTVGAPMLHVARIAKKMSDDGIDADKIIEKIENKLKNSFSFLYPESLTQLKKGGRVSPVAANMASLLKIKALLFLSKDGSVVDKFTMQRTENRIFEAAYKQFMVEKVGAKTHMIYVSHADNLLCAKRFIAFIEEKIENIQCEIVDLPAVLTCHGGLGCIAMQSILK